MKKVLILSDTHACKETIFGMEKKVLRINPDKLVHLGDHYKDINDWNINGIEKIRIPGTWTSEYQNIYVDNRLFITIENWKLFLSHTPTSHYNDLINDPDPEKVLEKKKCDIFLHGHTHIPNATKEHGIITINPGHLQDTDKRGYPMTYSIATFTDEKFFITIYHYETDDIYMEKEYTK